MPKTISDSLRNRIVDAAVTNLDGLEIKDSGGTVIALATGISWNAASGGTATLSGTPTATGNSNAGSGTTATNARLYDDSGGSGDDIDSLLVRQDQNFSSWSNGTSYSQGDKVTNTIDGTTYYFEATEAHTAGSKNKPGEGETWPDFWDLIDLVINQTNITDGMEVNINSLPITQPPEVQ